MEYQALARKYRPRNFASLMGQEHVSKALANALRTKRLHHAYLFSGTRGVGKTTIARILAKSLNCESGIVAEPCGQCATCREIDEGRFIDLLEVDAASKTKVEDTRDLLDNAQYAPVRGRFKVYLIDEVHMLSGHSFNALLKTLEEPPEHVKFLLATTDPQKLPVTVLSRCLQFNLRHLSMQQISEQLSTVLTAENIEFDSMAIESIAQAADGSMRDGLSLLDQAIAYSDGKLTSANIDSMLGNVPVRQIMNLISALIDNNAPLMIESLQEILNLGMGVDNVLTELINALQKMAIMQVIPVSNTHNNYDQALSSLAKQISCEDVQLYYQIALSGRSDLELSPFPQAALEMILLRMLAFKPVKLGVDEYALPSQQGIQQKKKPIIQDKLKAEPESGTESKAKSEIDNTTKAKAENLAESGYEFNSADIPNEWLEESGKQIINDYIDVHKQQPVEQQAEFVIDWNNCVYKIDCSGIEKEALLHSCLLEQNYQHNELYIKLGLDSDHQTILNDKLKERLKNKLYQYFSAEQKNTKRIDKLIFELVVLDSAKQNDLLTPRKVEKKQYLQDLQQAKNSINNDKNVQLLINQFSGKIIPDSILPLSEKMNENT